MAEKGQRIIGLILSGWKMDGHRIVCPDHYESRFRQIDETHSESLRMPDYDHEWEGGNCYYCIQEEKSLGGVRVRGV